jgi:hypothetical protein
LKSYAQGEHSNKVFWAVFISAFGVVTVAILGILGWEFLKRRYSKEVFNKRPKVIDREL